MKLFDVDWEVVLREMTRWSALSVQARRVLLDELKTNGYVQSERFGASLNEIVASGIPVLDALRPRLILDERHRELLKVLRAIGRHVMPDDAGAAWLMKYLEEHFTQNDIYALSGASAAGRFVHPNRASLAQRVAFAGWTGDLIASKTDADLFAWAKQRGESEATNNFALALRTLKALAQQLLQSPDGIPLRDVLPLDSRANVSAIANALHCGLRTLVLFATMRASDLEPMIGLWPPAARELARPPLQPPAIVTPAEHFALPVQMEDMTTLLAAVVSSPVRVRSADLNVFAKARAEIESRLVLLPEWAARFFIGFQQTRVDQAARNLVAAGFARFDSSGASSQLSSTKAGARWLALSPHDRLASLADQIRQSKQINPIGGYDQQDAIGFFPYRFPYLHAPKTLRLRGAITEAFSRSQAGFVVLDEFLDYEAVTQNPLMVLSTLKEAESQMYMNHQQHGDARETYRYLWRNALDQFLVARLFALGGASIGRLADGGICFAVNDVGRYVLGATDSFQYGAAATAEIVVQPNFDIVFLGIAPSVEATIARFAERVGVAPGLAFRITRATVLRAAEAGMTAERILADLSNAGTRPVPRNVQREIVGWIASVRRARLRSVELIECADSEAGERLVSLLGSRVRQLTATVFELQAATVSERATLLKRLKAGGVFLSEEAAPQKQKKKRVMHFEDVWDGDA
ncbi:MAG: helicase-associated domain-containing protein [Gemmatimonadota bacterium]|nr:helicase-associated domain-containing protein [Gemmatimonadota bacterium]